MNKTNRQSKPAYRIGYQLCANPIFRRLTSGLWNLDAELILHH